MSLIPKNIKLILTQSHNFTSSTKKLSRLLKRLWKKFSLFPRSFNYSQLLQQLIIIIVFITSADRGVLYKFKISALLNEWKKSKGKVWERKKFLSNKSFLSHRFFIIANFNPKNECEQNFWCAFTLKRGKFCGGKFHSV